AARSSCRPASPKLRSAPHSRSGCRARISRPLQNAMAAMRQMMMRAGGGGGQGGGASRRNAGEPSSYIVFTLKKGKPTPVQIRTGLTDLDYIEVLSGLTEQDTVLVLPSASLVNAQRDMQQRMRTIGGPPGVQQQQPTTTQQRPQATPTRP